MKKWNLQRIVFTLLIGILIIATAISYYFERKNLELDVGVIQTSPLKPSRTDPTRNWKSYTNEKYGFSLKYPREWQRIESLENKETVLYVSPEEKGAKPKNIEIKVRKNPRKTSTADYVENVVLANNPQLVKNAKIYPLQFSGLEAIMIEGLSTQVGARAFISNKDIVVEILSKSLTAEEEKELFKQIVYTFRWISG